MTSKEALEKIRDFRYGKGKLLVCQTEMYDIIYKDLEILDILRQHLYVASELVELKMTGKEYANIHNVKYHNGIPIVADLNTFNKINKWFYEKGGRK